MFKLTKRLLIKLLNYNIEDDEAYQSMLEMDPFTIITAKAAVDDVIKRNESPAKAEDIETIEVDLGWKKVGEGFADWKKMNPDILKREICDSFSTTVIGEDDLVGDNYGCREVVIGKALRNRFLFNLDDPISFCKTRDDSKTLLKNLRLSQGEANPTSYAAKPFDMLTDESFSRIFFYGIGAPILKVQDQVPARYSTSKNLGPFVVDLPLQDLEVRGGFRPYGACIHFSAGQKVTAIYDYAKENLLFPGDEGWDQAKFLAKVSAFLFLTAREHLVWTHLIVSNSATNEKLIHLPPSHPIRRLLTVFTYGTNDVNLRAFELLVPNTSLFHRATGLKYSSIRKVFDASYKECNAYEPFVDRKVHPFMKKMSDDGKFPYLSEGNAFFKIVHDFVQEWLSQAEEQCKDEQAMAFYNAMKKSSIGQAYEIPEYSEENMVNLLSQIIFTVTAFHELIGGVVDYVADYNDRAGFRVVEGQTQIDTQSFILTCIIGSATSVRMPLLMKDFKNFFGMGGAPDWERTVWSNFVNNMQKQSEVVNAANSKREVDFKYFDPKRFECSISV